MKFDSSNTHNLILVIIQWSQFQFIMQTGENVLYHPELACGDCIKNYFPSKKKNPPSVLGSVWETTHAQRFF